MPIQTNPQIYVAQISDQYIRKNFQNLSDYFNSQNQLYNFVFVEIVFSGAVTSQVVPHSLGVIPQDIILTKITGVGSATFLHGSFTKTNMYITTTGACRVRFFYGNYFNFTSSVNNQASDSTTYSPGAQTASAAVTGGTVRVPTAQILKSGTLYIPHSGISYIRIRMSGGGGGGSGSGSAGVYGISGTDGTTTTFGTNFLIAGSGKGAPSNNGSTGFTGGAGGINTLTSVPIPIMSPPGSAGCGSQYAGPVMGIPGGAGGGNPLAGAGASGGWYLGGTGLPGAPNTGGGGGGAGIYTGGGGLYGGGGGGAGGYIEIVLPAPLLASYPISIGTGGIGGAAGTSGFPGGNGGTGVIIVEEF